MKLTVMKINQEKNQLLRTWLLRSISIIISGLCWFFSNGLTGDYWYLLWIAPIPILYTSIKATGRQAFFISFISYLIGRLSWFNYLVSVSTLVPAIIITVLLSLSFAFVLVIARRLILKTSLLVSVFAFPVFFTAFEFLTLRFSADGTAASIAYSQSNVQPVIQIASITGILGITFIVTFIPSAIAICWVYIKERSKIRVILISSGAILLTVLLFGFMRIGNSSDKNSMKVGLIVLEEKYHDISKNPDFLKDTLMTQLYAEEISKLASQGAKLIVLPERAVNINKATENIIIGMLGSVAKQNQVFIIVGYTNFRNKQELNSALVIDDEGNVVVDYNKVHLVTGLENRFAPGKEIGLFKVQNQQVGISVCKDLDFPDYIRKYSTSGANLLTIPAWDFGVDDWLHSRMAVLRGVENGFSEIRTAREGRLTISDCYGHVNFESSSSNGQESVLSGNASLQKINTFYRLFGNWFGILVLIVALSFILLLAKNKNHIK